MLGERSGPVDAEWNRATVIVSQDRLLSPREMDYWTFAVMRLEDPTGAGVVGYDGVGSLEVASGNRLDLRTDIRPLSAAALSETFEVDYPTLGRRDWRDVVFRHRRADTLSNWSASPVVGCGVGTRPQRHQPDPDPTLEARRYDGRCHTRIGTGELPIEFIAETQFQPNQAGTYLMEVFLFWPGSGTQFSRAALSPIVVD